MRMARLHTGRHKVLARLPLATTATPTRAITLTGDPRRWAERARPCRASCTSSARTCTARRSTPTTPRQEMRARAAAPASRSIHGRGPGRRSPRSSWRRRRHRRHPGAAAGLPGRACGRSATSYGIVFIADEVMAGFGRCRRVVRVRPLGRRARPDHLRQGRQLRLRPARRRDHLRRRSPRPSHDRVYPGRPDLLRPPAGLRGRRRDHRRDGGRGHRRATRARIGDRRARARDCASWPSGIRRSARSAASACSGRSSWSRTGTPASRSRPTAAGAAPADERRWSRRASSAACCRSPTSTGCTSCRRAPISEPRPRRGWRSSTRRWPPSASSTRASGPRPARIGGFPLSEYGGPAPDVSPLSRPG